MCRHRSREFEPALLGDRTPTRAALLTVAFIVLAVAVSGVATYEQARFKHSVTGDIEAVLDEPRYEELRVVSIRTQYGGTDPFASPETVSVTLTKSASASYPRLSDRLYQRVAATDPSVNMSVQFESTQRTSGPEEDALVGSRLVEREGDVSTGLSPAWNLFIP